MVTAKAPGPAELVFTMNSHGDPEEVGVCQFSSAAHLDNYRMTLYMIYIILHTSAASFQTSSISRHHSWVSSLARLTNTDLEGASGDVRTIEFHIYQVQAILPGDESHGILICEKDKRKPVEDQSNHNY